MISFQYLKTINEIFVIWQEKDQTVVALQDEEFYEGDNPLEDDGDTERGSRGDNSDSSDAEDEDKDEEKWGRYRVNVI